MTLFDVRIPGLTMNVVQTDGYEVVPERPHGADRQADQIPGAHLVGPGTDEVINLFALAIRHGLTAQQLAATTFAYPTGASDIGSML